MPSATRQTLRSSHAVETIVERSRFITCAARASTVEQAMIVLDSLRQSDASHNCWAYRVGDGFRFSDDGEPGGTAGKPIYAAIEASGLDEVVVMVTRYFGGKKLGTGGLVRAYGGAASKCLREAEKMTLIPHRVVTVRVSHATMGAVLNDVETYTKLEAKHDADGATIAIRVPESDVQALCESLWSRSRGQAEVTVEDEAVCAAVDECS